MSKRHGQRWQGGRRWLAALLLVIGLMPLARAAGIVVSDPRIAADGEAYRLSADFSVGLTPRLEDVINRGIELHFVVDFELTRERWYWFDARIARHSRTYRLAYHALTRQYRLSTGGLHQGFPTLGEALRVLGRLRNWPVAERAALSTDAAYQAALRVRLDLSQMPRTFQVSARSNAEWNLDSGWLRWRFLPADAARAPGPEAQLEVRPKAPSDTKLETKPTGVEAGAGVQSDTKPEGDAGIAPSVDGRGADAADAVPSRAEAPAAAETQPPAGTAAGAPADTSVAADAASAPAPTTSAPQEGVR